MLLACRRRGGLAHRCAAAPASLPGPGAGEGEEGEGRQAQERRQRRPPSQGACCFGNGLRAAQGAVAMHFVTFPDCAIPLPARVAVLQKAKKAADEEDEEPEEESEVGIACQTKPPADPTRAPLLL